MGIIKNRGVEKDYPPNFANVGINSRPSPGIIGKPPPSKWVSNKKAVALYSFDFVNQKATINGQPAASFSDALLEALPDFPLGALVPGKGWVNEKVLDVQYNYSGGQFSPELLQRFTEEGLTATFGGYNEVGVAKVNTTTFSSTIELYAITQKDNYYSEEYLSARVDMDSERGIWGRSLYSAYINDPYEITDEIDEQTTPRFNSDDFGLITATITPDRITVTTTAGTINTPKGHDELPNHDIYMAGITMIPRAVWTGAHDRFKVTGKTIVTSLALYPPQPAGWTPN